MRLAVVGFGSIAERHQDVFRDLGVAVVASCNRSEVGRERARTRGIPGIYSELGTMLRSERPDAVLCCPSVHQNFHVARELLKHGVPTLLEKPPGTSLAQLDELIVRAREHSTPVLVGLNRLHYSVLANAISDAGGLEQLRSVRIEWSENPSRLMRRGFTPDQILRRNCSNSIHGLCLMVYLAGPLVSSTIHAKRLSGRFAYQEIQGGYDAYDL